MQLEVNQQVVGGDFPSPAAKIAHYITQVKDKLASGEYHTEVTKCVCDNDNDREVVQKDRYGIPHRMVMCQKCGILRANPRMTQGSYNLFYNNEYRQIYDTWEFGNDEPDEKNFQQAIANGYALHSLITEYFDFTPKVVFDIGCNSGGWLKAWQDEGAEGIGVDLNTNGISFGSQHGIYNLYDKDIDFLIKSGKKADFIILSHVLEHILNPVEFLLKIRQLMNPEALIYAALPGLYSYNNLDILFQNAHVWQFTSETLTYLMKICGFDEWYCDEKINSVYSLLPKVNENSREMYKKDTVEYLNLYLSGVRNKIPKVKTINKFSLKERRSTIDKILSFRKPDLYELLPKTRGGKAIIIGGGPSIDNYIDKIKRMQSEGHRIFCIERMYPWCHKHNITPDYVVVLDACDDVMEGFTHINPDTIHIVAVQANAKVMDVLKDHKTYVFNNVQKGVKQEDYWAKYGYKHVLVVNSGGSVTICAISLALTIGCDEFHIFGFDCHFPNKKEYADGIAGVGEIKNISEVKIDDRFFYTTTSYLSFLQQFFEIYAVSTESKMAHTFKIYGDSMVKFAAKVEGLDGDK